MTRLFRRLAFLFRLRTRDRELADEIAAHQQIAADALEAAGHAPGDAATLARKTMGNSARMREQARAIWVAPWFETVLQDVEYALRFLRRSPMFALVAVVALGAAAGLGTSLFTAFNALALRSFEARDPDRLVNVFDPACCAREGGAPNGFSVAEVEYFRSRSRTISAFAMTRQSGDVRPGEPRVTWVSGTYFSALGVPMALGRGISVAEDGVTAPGSVVVVRYGYWTSRLGGDSLILGKPITIGGARFTVVGVAAPSFMGTEGGGTDAWASLATASLTQLDLDWVHNVLRDPSHCCTAVFARLAPGVTVAQAERELSALHKSFSRAAVADAGQSAVRLTAFTPLGSEPPMKAQDAGSPFVLMFGAVAALLILACSNVGNLLLARAAARKREIQTRLALGASRVRVMRQLLTESLVLALLAGALGLAVASWLPGRIVELMFPNGPLGLRLVTDHRILLFALGTSILSCVLFGFAPALHATRAPTSGRAHTSLRSIFLAAQVALSVVLLVAAALLTRGVSSAANRDLGFAARAISQISIDPSARGYDATRTGGLVTGLLSSIQLTGLSRAVGYATSAPLTSAGKASIRIVGQEESITVNTEGISAGFFGVLGIPIVAGEGFSHNGTQSDVIVVNETLARQITKDGSLQSALGATLVFAERPVTVIGIARDARLTDVTDVRPMVFRAFDGLQIPTILVHSDDVAAQQSIKNLINDVDSKIRVSVTPLQDNLDRKLGTARLASQLASGLGLFALLLAAVGLYGVFAFWVQQRAPEIAVRMALGATPGKVIGLVLRSSGRAVLIGAAIGLAGAMMVASVLRARLYGLSPLDPIAFATAFGVLFVAAFVSTFIPARRATTVNPISALRVD